MRKVTDVKHGYRGPKNAGFDDIKKELAALLENAKKEGVVDPEVLPYLAVINAHPDYVTSSSCYGRIILIDLPNYKKKDSEFLWKQHRAVALDDAWQALQDCEGKFVWFKQDPLILHISCRDIDAAHRLLKVKTTAGMKRGGIFAMAPNRVQIELEGTYRLEAPVKKAGKLLVTKDYFSLLVENANSKFAKNEETWKRFAKEFASLS